MTLKHNAPEITYFTRQRWTGELHYSSVNGNAPTQSGEGANNPVFADHRGFDGFARTETHHKRDDRTCGKVNVCHRSAGFEQHLLVAQMDRLQVWLENSGITVR